jgi:hypothetical protein
MAVSVSGSISVSVSLSDVRSAVTGALKETGNRAVSIAAAWGISTGTTAGLADKIWGDTRTVLTTATDTVDLATVLTNAFGTVETFIRVKAVVVVAGLANTTTLTVARPAANGALLFAAVSDALAPISGGGFVAWCDPGTGFVVTAGTVDLISVINSAGGTATYDIAVVGTSA